MKKILFGVVALFGMVGLSHAAAVCTDYVSYYACAVANSANVAECDVCMNAYGSVVVGGITYPLPGNFDSNTCTVNEYTAIYNAISIINSTQSATQIHGNALSSCKAAPGGVVSSCEARCDLDVTGALNSACKTICQYNAGFSVQNHCAACASQAEFNATCLSLGYTQNSCTNAYPSNCQGSITRIAGTLYHDVNNNDLLDGAGDVKQGGVPVELLNNAGSVIDATTTDAGGTYQFIGLAVGTYSVRYTNSLSASLQSDSAQIGTQGGTLNGVTRIDGITLSVLSDVSENNNFGLVTKSGGKASSVNGGSSPSVLLPTGPATNTGTNSTGTNTTGTNQTGGVIPETTTPTDMTKTDDTTNTLLEDLKERNKNRIVGDSKAYDIILPSELPATGTTSESGLIVLITAFFALIAGAGYVISRK